MPAERLPMRKVREVLRQKPTNTGAVGLSVKPITTDVHRKKKDRPSFTQLKAASCY